MASIAPDNVEYKLLGLLQTGFPLTGEPYLDLGVKLGMTGNQVIQHIGELKAKGIVRQISPVLDARKLGYQSTLIAMKVPVEGIGRAEQILSGHVGVSHAYERDNEYNIWFTLSAPLAADMQSELRKLSSQIGVEADTIGRIAVRVEYFGKCQVKGERRDGVPVEVRGQSSEVGRVFRNSGKTEPLYDHPQERGGWTIADDR